MSTPPEPCRTCDGTGFVETAAQDSRVIHHEPCPDCAGPARESSVVSRQSPEDQTPHADLLQALVQEYAALLAHDEPWPWMPAAEPGQRDYFLGAQHALEHVAARLGVTDLHARAAEVVARGDEKQQQEGKP